jgi:transcriptional regulator
VVTFRKELLEKVKGEPRSVSSLARELGLRRGDVEEDLRHALRSAQAAGYVVDVLPARCRACGFTFDVGKLAKPGRCPECRGTRIYEAQVGIRSADSL